ncbi:MAG: Maf family protein [Oceanicoccus sp.]
MSSKPPHIYLASQSPRRKELLQQIGVKFEQISVDVDETAADGEDPDSYVVRVAGDKARAGWQFVEQQGLRPLPVLGADTAVIFGQQIMGKPRDRSHGLAMLSELSGQTHQVMSAVCFCWQGRQWCLLNTTEVTFRTISPAELQQYWDTGEPIGKAGAYAIQGRAAVFVERLKGSYSAVVGLPLLETHQLLNEINQTPYYE